MPDKSWKEIIEESKKATPTYELLPDNEYDFVVSKAEASQTKGTPPKDMIKAQVKVISGDHARRVLFPNYVLSYESPVAMGIFLRQMNVLGLDEAYFASDPSTEKIANDLVGKVFRGKVITKSDPKWRNGEPENVIQNYYTPSAEARQLALSVPTANNPTPAQSPTTSGGGSGAASAVPTPSAPPAPPVTPAAPPAPPAGTIPPPPPAPPTF